VINDIVTTVHVPRRLITLIAANIFIWMGVYAVIIGTANLTSGIVFFLIAAALIVPIIFVYYLLWRYFWWIWAILATSGTLLFLVILLTYPFTRTRFDSLVAQSGRSIVLTDGIILALIIVTLSPLLLWAFRGGNNSRPVTKSDSPFDFSPRNRQQPQQPIRPVRRNDELTPVEFQNEVARLLIEKNPELDISVRENQMDIDVYLDGKPIGIVRCKLGKSSAPIAPLFVQEVHRMKERLGLSIAYIATTGQVMTMHSNWLMNWIFVS
jgi:hypothetical protein